MTRRSTFLLLVLGMVSLVLGLRWAVIGQYGTDLPEWDQWDAEGLFLLLPWYQDKAMLPELFRPHNEHYVVLTKLLNLGLTVVNGQWDHRLECVTNATLAAAVAVGFLLLARRVAPAIFTVPFAFFLGLAWGLPISWHNVMSGFHSQQFFLIGLSFGTIALLPFATPYTPKWWLGVLCAVLVPLTMASGFLAAGAVLAIVVVRVLLRETNLRTAAPSLVVAVLICAIGWLTRHEVYYHAAAKATSAHDFLMTIIRALQWPAPDGAWLAALVWAPWALLSLHLVFRRDPHVPRVHGWTIVGLGLWVWLQLIATGYARGAGGLSPASRYLDTLLVGGCSNLLALAWLGWHAGRQWILRAGVAGLGTIWVAIFVWGIFGVTRQNVVHELPRLRAHYDQAVIQTRAYLATHDMVHLQHPDIPYPGADSYAQRLSHRELVDVLPPSVRTGYDPNHPDAPLAAPTAPLSRTALWLALQGRWFVASGAFLMLVTSILILRSSRPSGETATAG